MVHTALCRIRGQREGVYIGVGDAVELIELKKVCEASLSDYAMTTALVAADGADKSELDMG